MANGKSPVLSGLLLTDEKNPKARKSIGKVARGRILQRTRMHLCFRE